MKIDDIIRATDTIVDVEPRLWAWATLLGAARTASNDNKRHRRSDRGNFNSRVDLLGALGELFLLTAATAASNNEPAVAYMRDHLYRERGGRGVKGPDIRFTDEVTGILHEIDVKTFDCSPNKKFFAINDNKHRSLAGQCSAYFCIVAPPFGRRAAIARLVPYADVDRWPAVNLRWNGSPSRNCALQEFLERYFSSPPAIETLRSDVFSMDEIDHAKADSGVRLELTRLIPTLRDECAAES